MAGIYDPAVRRRWLTGGSLLAPALGVMGLMLALPLATLVVLSFWTQTGFQLDRSFTLENYRLLCRPCHVSVTLSWRAGRRGRGAGSTGFDGVLPGSTGF